MSTDHLILRRLLKRSALFSLLSQPPSRRIRAVIALNYRISHPIHEIKPAREAFKVSRRCVSQCEVVDKVRLMEDKGAIQGGRHDYRTFLRAV